MTAIHAILVNIKNVGVHKSIALTLHIPQELAKNVIDLFGWPTMANPVNCGLARLNMADASTGDGEAEGIPTSGIASATKPKREMTLANRIAIICDDDVFKKFLREKYNLTFQQELGRTPAVLVREVCRVDSRSEIKYDTVEAERWKQLYTEYENWLEKQS